ncbi:arginase family protein [Glutamicibacter endophyticus]|uniref:arginase family protein n=1 Tax=Glutamicibacter endophyticus TaxID=1522174 RepID=UPI003AF0F850
MAELVPADSRHVVAVADHVGNLRNGIRNIDVLADHLRAASEVIGSIPRGELIVTVGGDCGIELAPIEAAISRSKGRMAVVWLDAHADLNNSMTSPSGAFHGMVLRTLMGDGPSELRTSEVLAPNQVILAGARALDVGEQAFVETHQIPRLRVADMADPRGLVDAVRGTGADSVYLHLDFDVLDPTVFTAVGSPEPSGLGLDELLAAVQALLAEFRLAGVGLTEYEPSSGDLCHDDILRRIVAGIFDSDSQRADRKVEC